MKANPPDTLLALRKMEAPTLRVGECAPWRLPVIEVGFAHDNPYRRAGQILWWTAGSDSGFLDAPSAASPIMSERRPTIRAIAKAANVSPMTVSLALREHPSISPMTRERIRTLAKEMGYRPNPLVATLMSAMRANRPATYSATLALVTAYEQVAVAERASISARRVIEGIRHRAAELGYGLDDFSVREPGMTPRRLSDILHARGIPGLVLPGLPKAGGHLSLKWDRFAACAVGFTLVRPNLHRVVNHQYHTMRMAVRELTRRRYARIGLALWAGMNRRVDGTWLAAFLLHQNSIPAKRRVPPFLPEFFTDKPNQSDFETQYRPQFVKWLHRHKPDAVVGIDPGMVRWMRESGFSVPGDAGFVHLDWAPELGDCAGVDQNHDLIGAAAVDITVAQLHRNERGIPAHPHVTMIESQWREGGTIRPPFGVRSESA
jgi:LacI family transcriptional regulator